MRDEQKLREAEAKAHAHEDPLVQAILETFPGAKVTRVSIGAETSPPSPPPSDDELEAQLEAGLDLPEELDADFGLDDNDEDD